MARTFVNAGRRRQWTPTLGHMAGDLVYKDGYYGVVQDDAAFSSAPTAADRPVVQILDGVWDLKGNLFDASLIYAGKKIYSVPITQATTLQLFHNTASLAASAVAIGRTWATAVAGATQVRVVLFGPENQY